MGVQAISGHTSTVFPVYLASMLPKTNAPMKATTKAVGRAMTKSAIAKTLATQLELKQKVCSTFLNTLVTVATKEVSKTGVFAIPGLCRLKTRTKPATKAGKREMFGKVVMVKAKPAKKVVKAFATAGLKKCI